MASVLPTFLKNPRKPKLNERKKARVLEADHGKGVQSRQHNRRLSNDNSELQQSFRGVRDSLWEETIACRVLHKGITHTSFAKRHEQEQQD